MRVIPEAGAVPPNGGPEKRALPQRFKFHGQRKTLAWMVFKYGILTLLTLGIYRFWAKTHLRRYLWGATEFDGDRFEWHGTVKELFLGFLIAMAILLPILIGDSLIRSALVTSPAAFSVYSFVYGIALLFLFNFAFYRMWRYRLTRTSWRSIRFNMSGSASNYALHAILWSFLTGITAGLAYPWMQASLIRKRLNETEVGGSEVTCTLTGGQLFPRFLLCYFLAAMAIVIPVFVFSLLVGMVAALSDVFADGSSDTIMAVSFIGTFGGMLLIAPLLVAVFLFYRVFAYRKMLEATKLGSVGVYASVPMGPLVWSAIVTGFLIVLILAIPFGGSLLALFSGELFGGGDDMALAGVSIAIGLGMISTLLVMPLISTISMAGFAFTAIRTFLHGTVVENPSDLSELVQNAGPVPTTGEGFADALDIGAF